MRCEVRVCGTRGEGGVCLGFGIRLTVILLLNINVMCVVRKFLPSSFLFDVFLEIHEVFDVFGVC